MGQLIGFLITSVLSFVMNLILLSSYYTGDQIASFHQSVREAGRAAANNAAPFLNSSISSSDRLMVDEPYNTFQAALKAAAPKATIQSLQYWPVSPDNTEDVKVTATVQIPRIFFNALTLVGGQPFTKNVTYSFSVEYLREWDYNSALSAGAINPSSNGLAQSD